MSERSVEIMSFVYAGLGKYNTITGKDGTRFYLSKFSKDLSPEKFTLGNTYTVEIQKGNKGAIYIQKVVEEAIAQAAPSTSVPSSAKAPAKGETMTKADWAEKDKNQMIGGLMHDVAEVFNGLIMADPTAEAGSTIDEAVDLVLRGRKKLVDGL